MASAKKCDNCGKYYDPYKAEGIARSVGDGRGIAMDLCPECLKAVNKTLEKKRNQILAAPVIDGNGAFVFTKDYIKEHGDVLCCDCVFSQTDSDTEPCSICPTKIFFIKRGEEKPYGNCWKV